MSLLDLYVTRTSRVFAGIEGNERSPYRIIGVPYDSTTSYRPGARFGPDAIRVAAAALESNSAFVQDFYLEDIAPLDLGDVTISIGDTAETLNRVAAVISELAGRKLIPIIIGGEHTITLGALRALSHGDLCVVDFDAHFDLRDEYLGLRTGHATFMRRALEQSLVRKLVYVGVRAFSREELSLAKYRRIRFFRAPGDVEALGPINVASSILSELEGCERVYITVDMDVFDPAYAPGVGNPEPLGLTPLEALTIINRIVDERLAGIDVVEVAPSYDQGGVTSALAAKVIIEAVAKHSSMATRRQG